jgi:hypothetical protein
MRGRGDQRLRRQMMTTAVTAQRVKSMRLEEMKRGRKLVWGRFQLRLEGEGSQQQEKEQQ